VAKLICNRGFTALELCITLALACVLAGLAVAPLQAFVKTQEGEHALRSINELILLARSEAAANGRGVTLCPSIKGRECGGTWGAGTLLFLDRNFDRNINQDDSILRVNSGLTRRGTIAWRAFGNRQYLQVDSRGFLRHQSGNFSYCDATRDPRLARQLVVNSAGRVRIAVDSDGDGIRENSRGKALECD
jgi:type IV fimbrial biogenesis protein FimT